MGKLLGTSLWDRESAFLEIAEKISTIQLLHDDVDVILILEDIQKTDNVRVLAHLEDLDLSALQLNILHRHLPLGHDLDSNRLASLLVDG